jgi:hypothetical protein
MADHNSINFIDEHCRGPVRRVKVSGALAFGLMAPSPETNGAKNNAAKDTKSKQPKLQHESFGRSKGI